MSNSCQAFRGMLIEALSGKGGLTELGWHVHLHECSACRAVLEQEEALDAVLASLPEPQLPPQLVARVLSRLRALGALELDGLLELDRSDEPPKDLHTRVLASLSGARSDRQLERLLELDGVESPAGLSARILERLESARGGTRRVTRPAPLLARSTGLRSTGLRVAAGLLIVFGVWALTKGRSSAPDGSSEAELARAGGVHDQSTGAALADMPAADLLAALDVLENWEALEAGQDIGLDTFNSIDAGDEVVLELLLELEETEGESDNG